MKCPKCGTVYQFDDSKIPQNGTFTTCRKCQFRFFLKTVNDSEKQTAQQDRMVCPKCDHEQPYSASCAKCGIIFEKYRKRTSGKKRFRVRESLFLVGLCALIFLILGGAFLVLYFSSFPVLDAPEAAGVCFGILLIASGIVAIFIARQSVQYFIELSESGLKIADKKSISWGQIKDVKLEEGEGLIYSKDKWVEIEYVDKKVGKLRIAKLGTNIENFEYLYRAILEQLSLQENRLNDVSKMVSSGYGFDSADYHSLIWGITRSPFTLHVSVLCLAVGFFLFIVSLFPGEEDNIEQMFVIPGVTLPVGVALMIIGIIVLLFFVKYNLR